ncbi:MAG: DNA polymerase Y family protein [Gammaproteobacteria bacterium]|nr:DNA polymerase Y family protein [Gammaproteobacteria bacterium]
MARRDRAASTRRAFARLGGALHASPALSAPTAVKAPAGAPPGPPPISPPLGSLFDTAPEAWVALCWAADLDRLARLALDFSPRVSLEADAVLLEVRGSFRLFGGPQALCAQLLARCRAAGVEPRWALAPTPLAALALARAGQGVAVLARDRLVGALASLPLAVLRWSDDTIARLASSGVRTVGAALRLPRAGFARRFGPDALADLDRLVGLAPEPRPAFVPRERFRVRHEPSFELAAQPAVLREIAPLLDALESFLRARGCGIDLLMLRLAVREPPYTSVTLRLAAAEWLATRFAALLALHLARTALPAPVVRIGLRSGALRAVTSGSAALWRPGEHGGGLGRESPALIERLRARLGSEAVYGLCLVPRHRPEVAWRVAEPALPGASRTAAASGVPGQARASDPADLPASGTRRPLWLLREPEPLPWPYEALQRLEGPERIETGWWDGADVARDYYIAREPSGAEVWVYRERLPPHGWWLHGVFG